MKLSVTSFLIITSIFLISCDTGNKSVLELEKNEKIDKNLLKFMTIKVKKFDLKTNYFSQQEEKKEINK